MATKSKAPEREPQTQHVRQTRALITDRVNVEPPILNGMTVTEAQVIGIASVVLGLVAGMLLWALTGVWQLLMVLCIFGPVVCLWYASSYLAGIKRGRPDGFYTQALRCNLTQKKLMAPVYIGHPSFWDLGVHLGADLL